jgi:hypothetical protein
MVTACHEDACNVESMRTLTHENSSIVLRRRLRGSTLVVLYSLELLCSKAFQSEEPSMIPQHAWRMLKNV